MRIKYRLRSWVWACLLYTSTLTKISLVAAGEIRPEGRTSARVENQPEAPVELS